MLPPECLPEQFARRLKECPNQVMDGSSYDVYDRTPKPPVRQHRSKYIKATSQQQSWAIARHRPSSTPTLFGPPTETLYSVPSPFPLSYLRDRNPGSSESPQSYMRSPQNIEERPTGGVRSELSITAEFTHNASTGLRGDPAVTQIEAQFTPTAPRHHFVEPKGSLPPSSCAEGVHYSPAQTSCDLIHFAHSLGASQSIPLMSLHSKAQEIDPRCTSKGPIPPLAPGRFLNTLPSSSTADFATIPGSQLYAASMPTTTHFGVLGSDLGCPQTILRQAPGSPGCQHFQPLQCIPIHHDITSENLTLNHSLRERNEGKACGSLPNQQMSNLSETPLVQHDQSWQVASKPINKATKKRTARAPAQESRPPKQARIVALSKPRAQPELNITATLANRSIGVIDNLTMAGIVSYAKPGENLDWTVEGDQVKRKDMQNTIKRRKQKESMLLKKGLAGSGGNYPGVQGVRAYLTRAQGAPGVESKSCDDARLTIHSSETVRADTLCDEQSVIHVVPKASSARDVEMVDDASDVRVANLNLNDDCGVEDIKLNFQNDKPVMADGDHNLSDAPEVCQSSFEELMESESEKPMRMCRNDGHKNFHVEDSDKNRDEVWPEANTTAHSVEQSSFMSGTEDPNVAIHDVQSHAEMATSSPHVTFEMDDSSNAIIYSSMLESEKEESKASARNENDENPANIRQVELEDIRPKSMSNRQQLAGGRSTTDRAPLHDIVGDRAFVEALKCVLEKQSTHKLSTWMKWSCRRVLGLLEIAEPPNGTEALFLSGDDATKQLSCSSQFDGPIFAEGQQTLDLQSLDDFFDEQYDDDATVFVQVPSVPLSSKSWCQAKKMSEVKEHFAQPVGSYPWNLLELASHIEDGTRPRFLNQENCRLLTKIKFPGKKSAARNGYLPGWKEVEKWVLVAEAGAVTGPHQDSHGFNTYITVQQGLVGFGWLSNPTPDERAAWVADTDHFAGGRWRYVVLKPGQTVAFPSGTVHFVFRSPTGGHTLAFGGHYLRCSQIVSWVQTILEEQANGSVTNEDLTVSAPEYMNQVEKFVRAAARQGKEDLWGGPHAIAKFLELKDAFSVKNKDRHARAQARRRG
nr:hypothetical protein CFP56_60716 [Quercus suber]